MKLRINKPAPVRVSDNAISTTTRPLRSQLRRKPPATPLPESLSDSTTFRRAACSAGTRPKTTAVATAAARLKSRTGTLRRITASRGMYPVRNQRGDTLGSAIRKDAPECRADSTEQQALDQELSHQMAASCPNAPRMAISFSRPVASASSMFATLKRKSPAAARPPRPACQRLLEWTNDAVDPADHGDRKLLGVERRMLLGHATGDHIDIRCGLFKVTPGLSFAWNMKKRPLSAGSPGCSRTGRQRSAASFVKRCGMIPIAVVGTPLSVNVLPTTFGSRLKCFAHIL